VQDTENRKTHPKSKLLSGAINYHTPTL